MSGSAELPRQCSLLQPLHFESDITHWLVAADELACEIWPLSVTWSLGSAW